MSCSSASWLPTTITRPPDLPSDFATSFQRSSAEVIGRVTGTRFGSGRYAYAVQMQSAMVSDAAWKTLTEDNSVWL